MKTLKSIVILLIVPLLLAGATIGFKGKVKDYKGKELKGCTVVMENQITGRQFRTITGNRGEFIFNSLPSGKYRITITAANHIPLTRNLNLTSSSDREFFLNKVYIPELKKEKELTERVITEKQSPAVRHIAPARSGALCKMKRKTYFAGETQSFTQFNTEEYSKISEPGYKSPLNKPLSTFSIDVDTASYTNIRRFINRNATPPADAVRIEEMINYFDYSYPLPSSEQPFSVTTTLGTCPWNSKHQLLHIGLKGRTAEKEVPGNLVFLIDVSGSMSAPTKLPLLKSSFRLLLDQLNENDRVALVVYAGAAGVVLPSTPCNRKEEILRAIDSLEAGGSTAGGAGINLAYKIAEQAFIKGGNNRIILATDGDFNVGLSSSGALVRVIEEKRKKGIFLTILGFGMGNYKDSRMEELSNKGNGNYYYIDNILEARKVLCSDLQGTLFTIAKDVKIQVEFNPSKVYAYRLIGYENRSLAAEDFNNDKKDAGEMGAGHTVTALYEIVPAGSKESINGIDTLKYQKTYVKKRNSSELGTIKLRYKKPEGKKSRLIQRVISSSVNSKPGDNFCFSAAVAQLGMLLRNSEFKGKSSYSNVIALAEKSKGSDKSGYRAEFIKLVKMVSIKKYSKASFTKR